MRLQFKGQFNQHRAFQNIRTGWRAFMMEDPAAFWSLVLGFVAIPIPYIAFKIREKYGAELKPSFEPFKFIPDYSERIRRE